MLKYVILILASMNTVFAADTKDVTISKINQQVELMCACKKIEGFNNANNINSDEPRRLWHEHHLKLNKLLDEFANSSSGITKVDLWRIYLSGDEIRNITFGKFITKNVHYKPKIFPDKTLMRLVQKVVTENAAIMYCPNDLKLEIILRHDTFKFFKLLEESFTLYEAMIRASQAFNKEDGNFLLGFIDELKAGYWKDNDFVLAISYLMKYLKYEFLLAKNNKKSLHNYPGLKKYNADQFARQQMANILALYLVVPFLVGYCKKDGNEAKAISGLDKLYINYSSLESDESSQANPWDSIITLILGKNQ